MDIILIKLYSKVQKRLQKSQFLEQPGNVAFVINIDFFGRGL